ncbi:hypothetical protein [Ilumatobacter sp.]|uniref:hypothetical protein n=1 Tax=Ilumatobacter sp. TaxID=1967498 RepID=UPI003752F87B
MVVVEHSAPDTFLPMPISPERDDAIRLRLAEQFRSAGEVIDPMSVEGIWPIGPGSAASNDRLLTTGLPNFLVAEVSAGGVHLPLTQARSLMEEAAMAFVSLGLQSLAGDPALRAAAIPPIARAAAEKAATAFWVLDDPDSTMRLNRSLVVEIAGLDSLLRFYPQIATEDGPEQRLRAARDTLIHIAERDCGPVRYKRTRLSINDVALPSLTQRVKNASGQDNAYAEQSASTHPTGHATLVRSTDSRGSGPVVTYRGSSTLHDEGRIVSPAAVSFARTATVVAQLISCRPIYDRAAAWLPGIADSWSEWCSENGC